MMLERRKCSSWMARVCIASMDHIHKTLLALAFGGGFVRYKAKPRLQNCSHCLADNATRPAYCLMGEIRQIMLFFDAVSEIASIFCAQRKENDKADYDNIERARKVLSGNKLFPLLFFLDAR